MEWKKWRPYVIGAAVALAVGGFSGLLSMGGMKEFETEVIKPPLSPPGWLFPVVWTVLYTLMGISSGIIWQKPPSRERSRGLNLYAVQLVVNFFWSLLFFNARAYALAAGWLVMLWGLVLVMIFAFRRLSQRAAWIQLPYLAWLTFAAYLNLGVWLLNQ